MRIIGNRATPLAAVLVGETTASGVARLLVRIYLLTVSSVRTLLLLVSALTAQSFFGQASDNISIRIW